MAISLRTMRARVFSYADVGTDGVIDSVYVEQPSGDDDGLWWCSEGFEGGSELTVAAHPEHRRQGVFVFAAESPLATETVGVHYALIVNGLTYAVRSITPARYGTDEVIVSAEHVSNLDLTTSVAAVPDLDPAFLELTPENLTLEEGESGQLMAVAMNRAMDILPAAVVIFMSSDESIAIVDADGLVTALDEGSCEIIATSGSAEAACMVTVTGATTDLLFAYNAGDDLTDAVFTRASTADYTDENGDPQTAGVDVPRDDHWIDGVRTLLLEPEDLPRAADSIEWPPIADGVAATEYWKYVDLDTAETVEGIDDAFITPIAPITLATGRAWESYKIAAGVKTLVEMIAL